MMTTIQVSDEIRDKLSGMKLFSRETYSDVIERLLEDMQELSEKTKKEIEQAIADIEAGRCKTHEELRKEMGF